MAFSFTLRERDVISCEIWRSSQDMSSVSLFTHRTQSTSSRPGNSL